jgi:nucleoside-diphosphate-sugar epimerase
MSAKFHALVAGASGVVGRRLAQSLAQDPDWDVIGLSRRTPAHGDRDSSAFKTLAVDLTNADDCRQKLGALTHITHILYAARYDHKATAPEPIDLNTDMLRHLVNAVEPHATNLQHIHMVQGSKYYGSTLPAYKTPALERDPRVPNNPNFYYTQEDFLIARKQAAGGRWSWTASRPHAVCDFSTGFARALGMVIAVYATICKELGEPLHFPGTAGNYHALYQCTEAALLARAIRWMTTDPRCANQQFNITNGDTIRWKNLWPVFADYFSVKPGDVHTQRLAETMTTPDKAAAWERISKNYCLKTNTYNNIVIWSYGDFVFSPTFDIASSTIKARQFGFHECIDTERMFIELFDYYRREKVIP